MFAETDEALGEKVVAAAEFGLRPMLCVGETIDERRGGSAEEVVRRQLEVALAELDVITATSSGLSVAYEPVWAIGTGVTATAAQAQEAHAFVRSLVAEQFGGDSAAKIRIQYGGSVKPGNAAELMACPDIDGALIGGASLEPQSFLDIIEKGAPA